MPCAQMIPFPFQKLTRRHKGFRQPRKLLRDLYWIMWLGGKDAGEYLGVSRDFVEERAVAWVDEPVPGMLRYKHMVTKSNGEPIRRYFVPDLDALLHVPRSSSRSRPRFSPRFSKLAPLPG